MKYNIILADISSLNEGEVTRMMDTLKKEYHLNTLFLESSNVIEQKQLAPHVKTFSGNYYLNTLEKVVIHQGYTMKLTNKEQDLLELLVSHKGEVVTFDEIIHHVWKYSYATRNSLRTLIYRLRNKFDNKFDNKIIEGLPCSGYRLP